MRGDETTIAGAIDSNVLLSILLGDPGDQAEAGYTLLQRLAAEHKRLRVYPLVVAEIVFVLERQYKADRATVAVDVSSLMEHAALAVEQEPHVLEALALYGRHNVPFGDALIAISMQGEGMAEIFSWDPHFERVPGLVRRRPE